MSQRDKLADRSSILATKALPSSNNLPPINQKGGIFKGKSKAQGDLWNEQQE